MTRDRGARTGGRRRWLASQDRARVAAELLEEAESFTPIPPPPKVAASPQPAAESIPQPSPCTPWDREKALAMLDASLAGSPESAVPALLLQRAELLSAMGRYAAAQQDLLRLLQDDPGSASGLMSLGTLLARRGLCAEGATHLRRAAELDPARGEVWYHLGEALNRLDDLPGALAAFTRAAELQPRNARALHGQGVVLDRMRRPADATVLYRRAREVGGRSR